MKLNRIHVIIGFFLIVVPFLGFTKEFKYGISVVGGSIILYFAINSIHIELRKKHRKPHRHDTFVESKPLAPKDEVQHLDIKKMESSEIIENLETPSSDTSDGSSL